MMNQSFLNHFRVPNIALICAAILLASAAGIFGQTPENKGKNNPYSPSPSRKTKQETPAAATSTVRSGTREIAFVTQPQNNPVVEDQPTVAQRTFKIAKNAETRTMPPTETYKVGIGDVLVVNLKNAAQAAGYYTVRPNGTIDFPLAGENLIVADQTVDDIEGMLADGITLYADPQVEVKVREYGSHKITISGMVDNAGEKSLQREAIPLYVVRADAVVNAKATKAVITRAPMQKNESYDLRDANTDNVLLYPGNSIEFTSDSSLHGSANGGSYFISGSVASAGQKELTSGLTLYQALAASGGTKGDPKKAVIRRKNDHGLLANTEYNLRSIRDGKAADPALAGGDVIEIKN